VKIEYHIASAILLFLPQFDIMYLKELKGILQNISGKESGLYIENVSNYHLEKYT
jgi:hypothetical protein